jgi:hypothetical protein
MNAAVKRKKPKEPPCMIPAGWVPQWMLGKPLIEWLVSQLPEAESEAILKKIKTRLEEKGCESGGNKTFA